MNLRDAVEGKEYVVRQIDTEDEDLKGGCIVSIKDGRYNIDHQLADAIII